MEGMQLYLFSIYNNFNMLLQDQCCSREQGKRLQELGITSHATFYHMPAKDGPHGEYIRYGWHGDAVAPAFTVAELGILLGESFLSWFDRGLWHCGIQSWGYMTGITEAQARAGELISRLEQGDITAEEANNRLNS